MSVYEIYTLYYKYVGREHIPGVMSITSSSYTAAVEHDIHLVCVLSPAVYMILDVGNGKS